MVDLWRPSSRWGLISLDCSSGHSELWSWSFWNCNQDRKGVRYLLLLPFRGLFDGFVVVNVPVPVQFYGWIDG